MASDTVRKRLGLFLNNDESLIDAYLKSYGERVVMKNIKAIREDFQVGSDDLNEEDDTVDSGLESPIYPTKVTCPVCGTVNLNSVQMKAKSLVVTYNRFFAPVYSGASGFQGLDYNRYAVTVCPKCYFASPDRKDFITFSNLSKSEKPSQLSRSVLYELGEAIEDRREFVSQSGATANLFEQKKDLKQSRLAYQLCIMRANVEILNKNPYASYKAGSYALKMALIDQMLGNDDTQALQVALQHYKAAFEHSDYPSEDIEYRTCYVIAALLLRMGGREKEARQFMSVLDRIVSELEQDKSNPKQAALVTSAKRWAQKAKDLWDDREYDDLWDIPKPPKA